MYFTLSKGFSFFLLFLPSRWITVLRDHVPTPVGLLLTDVGVCRGKGKSAVACVIFYPVFTAFWGGLIPKSRYCLLPFKLPVLPWSLFLKMPSQQKSSETAGNLGNISKTYILVIAILTWLEANIFHLRHREIIRLYTNASPQSVCSDTSVTFC